MSKKIICGYVVGFLNLILGIVSMALAYKIWDTKVNLINGNNLDVAEYGVWIASAFLVLGLAELIISTVLYAKKERFNQKNISNKNLIVSIVLGFVSFVNNIFCVIYMLGVLPAFGKTPVVDNVVIYICIPLIVLSGVFLILTTLFDITIINKLIQNEKER